MTNYTPSNDHPSYKITGSRPACGKAVGPLSDMVACALPVGHEDDCEAAIYEVRDYQTGDALDGDPSDELVRESEAETKRAGTGAVAAYLEDGVWIYVPESEVEAHERVGDEVRTVYVVEA